MTLATQDMARAVRFYRALGFVQAYGGETAAFTSFRVGQGHVNLIRTAPGSSWSGWGRVIFYVDDVDAMYAHARAQGFTPQAAPEDAPWGERFFHLTDPDGHELSFASAPVQLEGTESAPVSSEFTGGPDVSRARRS